MAEHTRARGVRADGGPREPPAPANAAILATYNRHAAAYDRLVAPLQGGTRGHALSVLDASYGDTVLEVGCGPGRGLVALADAVGPSGRVVGLDAAPGMVRRAASRVARTGLADRVSVVLGDARSPPVVDSAFDAVFVEDTLELFTPGERRTVLAAVDRVLDRHGRLAVVTMDRQASPDWFVRAYDRAFGTVPGLDRFGCRPIEARAALEAAGFEVEVEETLHRAWLWPVTVLVADRE